MSNTPTGPDPGRIQPSMAIQVLGGNALKDAADVLGRSAQQTATSQKKLADQISPLVKVLDRLTGVLSKMGGQKGTGSGSGSGHSYGPLGGGPTIGGQPIGQSGQARGGAQPQAGGAGAGAGGGGRTPSGHFTYGPNGGGGGWRPGPLAQFGMGLAGHTPRVYGTRHTLWTGAGETVRELVSSAAGRGVAAASDQLTLDMIEAFARQRGIGQYQGLGVRIGLLGAQNLPGMAPGEGALSVVQSTRDATVGWLNSLQYVGAGRSFFQGMQQMKTAAAGLGYMNPGLSYSQATQVIGQSMLKPSQRLNMMLLGLPDPVAPDGSYKGNARFFEAFLKRIYQNREAVPPEVFEDDFREGGVGLENLRMVVGEEAAMLMLEPLRAYNKAKFEGKNVSDFDTLTAQAADTGEIGKRARSVLKQKYGIEDTAYHEEQRIAAKARGSELAGHDTYMEAYETGARAADTFADAVHEFVNAPFIKEVKNWTEAFFGRFFGSSEAADSSIRFNGGGFVGPQGGLISPPLPQGLPPGNGIGGLLESQGPEPKVNSNGNNAASGGDAGSREEDKPGGNRKEKLEKLRQDLVEYAKSYTQRRLRYSMERRNEPGYDDCSSFVTDVFARFGYKVGPTTVQLWRQGVPVSLKELLPGDVLLSGSRTEGGGAAHTGIYIGGGKYVDVNSRRGDRAAQIKPMSYRRWDGARRIIGAKGMKRGKEGEDWRESTSGSSSASPTGGGGSGTDWGSDEGTGSGETRYGIMSAGLGGGTMGLGSPNAAAYSSSELGALAAILSGGGGGGGGLIGADASAEDAESDTGDGGTGGEEETASGGESSTGKKGEDLEYSYEQGQKDLEKGTGIKARGDLTDFNPSKYRSGKTNPDTVNIPKPVAHTAVARANQAKARRLLAWYPGWADGRDWQALVALWNKESGWNHLASNPSGAYGIPQAKPGSKMASEGSDWRTNPETQIKWGLKYIKSRYGDPEGAWAHSVDKGWYDKGAWRIPKDELAVVHKDEMIIPAREARTIREALVEETLKQPGSSSPTFSSSADSGGMTINLNFQPGSIVLNASGGPNAGQSLARQFIRELEKKDLYRKIARGEGVTFGPAA